MPDTQRKNKYLGINITVQAIIVAALLIWVQYWNHSYDLYVGNGEPIWHISLSIAAIFTAVSASLLSILLTLLYFAKNKDCFIKWILGFSGFSITTLILVAVFSAGTIWYRALDGAAKWSPFYWIKPECATEITIATTVFGVCLLLVWVFCWGRCLAKKLNTE